MTDPLAQIAQYSLKLNNNLITHLIEATKRKSMVRIQFCRTVQIENIIAVQHTVNQALTSKKKLKAENIINNDALYK